jgi:hypothetical protein
MPSGRRLCGGFPKEGETRVGVPVNDHAAGEAVKARARS